MTLHFLACLAFVDKLAERPRTVRCASVPILVLANTARYSTLARLPSVIPLTTCLALASGVWRVRRLACRLWGVGVGVASIPTVYLQIVRRPTAQPEPCLPGWCTCCLWCLLPHPPYLLPSYYLCQGCLPSLILVLHSLPPPWAAGPTSRSSEEVRTISVLGTWVEYRWTPLSSRAPHHPSIT